MKEVFYSPWGREMPNCLELALSLEDKNRRQSGKEVGSEEVPGSEAGRPALPVTTRVSPKSLNPSAPPFSSV